MIDAFLTVLSVSFSAGVLGVLISVVSSSKLVHTAPKWMCVCYLVISLRLLIPFGIDAEIWTIERPAQQTAYNESSNIPEVDGVVDGAEISADTSGIDWLLVTAQGWIAGTVGFVLLNCAVYAHERRRIRKHGVLPDDVVRRAAEDAALKLGVKQRFELLCVQEGISPMLMGLFRPILVLPSGLSGDKLETAIAHELTHLKRGDLWLKMLLNAANAVHWFDPLVWVMVRYADRYIEMACDAQVLADAELGERRKYCDTILELMSGNTGLLTVGLAYRKEDIMKRFENIMNKQKRAKGRALAVLLLIICALMGSAVGCAGQDVPAPDMTGELDIDQVHMNDTVHFYTEPQIDTDEVMALINTYRTQNGLSALSIDDENLDQAAQIRLGEIQSVFSHDRPDGSCFSTVFKEAGVTGTDFVQACGWGQLSPEQIVDAWLEYSNIRRKILNENITTMSVAAGIKDDTPYWLFLGYAE